MSFLGSLAGLVIGGLPGAAIGTVLTKKKKNQKLATRFRDPNTSPRKRAKIGRKLTRRGFDTNNLPEFRGNNVIDVLGGGRSVQETTPFPFSPPGTNGTGQGFGRRPSPQGFFSPFAEASFLRGLSPQAPQSSFAFDSSRARAGANARLPFSPYYRPVRQIRFPTGPVANFNPPSARGTGNQLPTGNFGENSFSLQNLITLLRGLGGFGDQASNLKSGGSLTGPGPVGISPIEKPTEIIAGQSSGGVPPIADLGGFGGNRELGSTVPTSLARKPGAIPDLRSRRISPIERKGKISF